MADLTEIGMIFIRCDSGISHHPLNPSQKTMLLLEHNYCLMCCKLLRSPDTTEVTMEQKPIIFEDLDPPKRLLMGPGPVDVYPSVLDALSKPMLGQFDPQFTEYMNQVMILFRQVFRTENQWTLLIDGTSRAAIEACLVSMIGRATGCWYPGSADLVSCYRRL